MNPHILMVDDDKQFSVMTKEFLELNDMVVDLVHNGDEAIKLFKTASHDICILDIKMPIRDGYSVAEEIKAIREDVPFIFLSGLREKQDRIKGLKLGADDYITKPFSMEELLLRILNILKRIQKFDSPQKSSNLQQVGIFTHDSSGRELTAENGFLIKLTAIESLLLQLLTAEMNEIVSREKALKKVWGDEHAFHGRSLNVYISKLRSYLKEDARIEILNVHGVGYKLVFKDKLLSSS